MVILEIKLCQTQRKKGKIYLSKVIYFILIYVKTQKQYIYQNRGYLFWLPIIDGCGPENRNVLLNLKSHQDIDKIYSYAKSLSETKYYVLIKKHEKMVPKHLIIEGFD